MMVVVIGEDSKTNKKRIEPMPRIGLVTSSLPSKSLQNQNIIFLFFIQFTLILFLDKNDSKIA